MQAVPMEELNHIWTMQGGELAYRLSAAYEFALIAIEPLLQRPPAVPTRTAVYDVKASMDGRDQPTVDISDDTTAVPLAGTTATTPPPTSWLPVQMLVDGDTLTNALDIAQADTAVDVALAGPFGEEVALEIVWTLADASEQTQAAQIFPIQAARIDDPASHTTVTLAVPATAVSGRVLTRAAEGGAVLAESPFANTLTLTVS
jgi:hypothetical protein